MSQKAHVTSLDVLESFRASLIVYLSQARPALDEISSDVIRTRSWIEYDQRTRWEKEMQRRKKKLDEAQQALFSARIGMLRIESSAEQMAVHRARRAVDEADHKLRVLKKWIREFDGQVQPPLKQVEKLHTVLSNDMAKAVAYLTEAVNTLAAYAELQAPSFDASTTSPSTGQGGQTTAATATTPAGTVAPGDHT